MKPLSLLLIAAALLTVPVTLAQPEPIECPLPPYQLPLTAPPPAFVNEFGEVVLRNGNGTAIIIYDEPGVNSVLWPDDGEVILILTVQSVLEEETAYRSAYIQPDGSHTVLPVPAEARVLAYRDGELSEVLDHETLLGLRDEPYRTAVQLFNPAFIPGTHTILFNTQLLAQTHGPRIEIQGDLWSLDVDTGELTELFSYGDGGQFHIAPNGEHIVLIDDSNRLRVADLRGRNERTLIDESDLLATGRIIVPRMLYPRLFYPDIAWDADDPTVFRTLLRVLENGNNIDFWLPFEIWQFDIDAPDTGKSTLLEYFEEKVPIPAIRLSPDGYRALTLDWPNQTVGSDEPLIRVHTIGSDEPLLIDKLQPDGESFIRWLDEWHIEYGYHDGNTGEITAWRADLCGDIEQVPQTGRE